MQAAALRRFRQLTAAFAEHRLLTYANAIAFRIAFAAVPVTLATLGLAGAFQLQGQWQNHLGPQVAKHVSAALYIVIDNTVQQVFDAKQLWWATLGALLALWQVSAAQRALMEVLDSLYEVDDGRDRLSKYAVSLVLAALTLVLMLAAIACVEFGGGLLGGTLGAVARWLVALALLTLLISLLSRYAAAERRSWRLASRGGGVTTG